jgi:hypothetical protein
MGWKIGKGKGHAEHPEHKQQLGQGSPVWQNIGRKRMALVEQKRGEGDDDD